MKKSILMLVGLLACFACVVQAQSAPGKVRTYYVAADEVNWDYAPSGRDEAMGHPFDDARKRLHGIGTTSHRPRVQEGDLP